MWERDLTIHDLIHCFWYCQSHGKDWWHNMPDVCTVRMRGKKMSVFTTILIYTNLFVRACIVNAWKDTLPSVIVYCQKIIRHCLMTQKTCTHRHVKDRFSMVTHSVWHLCKICKVQDNLLSYPLQNSIVQNETHLLKHSESFMRVVFKYQFSHQRKTVRRII